MIVPIVIFVVKLEHKHLWNYISCTDSAICDIQV